MAALTPGSEIARILERVLLRRRLSTSAPPSWLPGPLQVALHGPEPEPRPLEGPDPDDLEFLALAEAIGAVLVTGNFADFPPLSG